MITVSIILYGLVVLALGAHVLVHGERPSRSIAWILAILVIPVFGMVFYAFFGLNRRRQRFFNRQRQLEYERSLIELQLPKPEEPWEKTLARPEVLDNLKLVRLLIKNSRQYLTTGNRVTFLLKGKRTFNAIYNAIENARKFVHFQFYIIEDGHLAERFLELFERKAREGVEIRLLYDGIGSIGLSRQYINRLKQAGVRVEGFLPVIFKWILSLNYRNHRKIVVVDGHTGFTGGINVSDKYLFGHPQLGEWHDVHLMIQGPAVRGLNYTFSLDWHFATNGLEALGEQYFPLIPSAGNSPVQIVSSDPESDFSAVLQQYFTIVNQAYRYVYIANSYVIPDEALLVALQSAAMSGVDIRLLLPAKSEGWLLKFSIRSYFEDLLKAGVKIFLFQQEYLHSKIIVADDTLASVGTANLDIRSFEQNFEVNAVIYDSTFAREVRDHFLEDCSSSIQLDPEVFANRHIGQRLLEGVARIFSPVL